MPIYIIKNYLKLIIRNKWIVCMMVFGPIIIMSVVSSAFHSILKSYEVPKEFSVGYYVEGESVFSNAMSQMKEKGEESGIKLIEYPSFDQKDLENSEKVSAFIVFHKDSYKLYQLEDKEMEGNITEYFLNQIVDTMTLKNMAVEGIHFDFPSKQISTVPDIDSEKYYGIIYIVYFIWCSFATLASVLSGEKKSDIQKKFQVSGLSSLREYIAKLVACIIATTVEMGITMILAHFLFGLCFGKLLLSLTIIFTTICAASVFGLFLYYVFNNLAVAVILEFSISWFLAFIGGTFEAYFTQNIPDSFQRISPVYHTNRALVELYCYNSSDFAASGILYSLAIIVIGSLISIGLISIRKG